MNDGISHASKMLVESGEFHPYGRTLGGDLAIVDIAAFDDQENPEDLSLLDLLEKGLRTKVASDSDIAIATFTKVKLRIEAEKPLDAVQVGLEHEGGYSINIYLPYSITTEGIHYDDPIPTERDAVVYP
ncbi:MAG: hypothetical protein AAF353_01055 [Pseudomonadota bacterium]